MMQRFDIVVAGGGPAGMAAAVSAAECGKQVAIVDDNLAPGGQIWRGKDIPATAKEWQARVNTANVTYLQGARIFAQPAPAVVRAEQNGDHLDIAYQKLILATGARERFLPFPGWTLPNVLGTGGLQALVKSGLSVQGKSVVVAGSGPLLLAVAAYLRAHGAKVLAICEQAPFLRLLTFATSLVTDREKLRQAIAYKLQMLAVPFHTSCWPVSAQGRGKLESVTLRKGNRTWTIVCDYLACGFHLVPNTELAELLGCRIADGKVAVDEWQQTSVLNVYCAGEPTGIGGVELALIEGQIAGYASAGEQDKARAFFHERANRRDFARKLEETFALDPALKELASDDTFVCRCEDVPYRALKHEDSWRAAKLHTRCGMGPCQGRICGPATEFLFGWSTGSVRPPIFPTTLSCLGATPELTELQETR
ncbi:FAD-dependent oxidoreductase [Pseudacidobacterium ailaaui]|jgi:NADPH-dependent 2,4-dienoyl-CoA reductase/sulfur reductase-like enzyme|uniref:FAD-dependent oxidoreductase n=1 Tax=Pseudacidobacterium ailaaui TaxID=1382359 RepID=UPI000AFEEF97|nr:FAD/NAD(P)-binding oxidoreductase [Pseudacidobacterium ailaaui]